MTKKIRKLVGNRSGFTLTEVMIGITILTIAIVTATNLLNGLIRSNKNNVYTLKAYYFAQEGIEAIRNIRDTNWLHNIDFDGEVNGIYPELSVGSTYSVFLDDQGWVNSQSLTLDSKEALNGYLPWDISVENSDDPYDSAFALGLDSGGFYSSANAFGSIGSGESIFYRHIDILSACDEGVDDDYCENSILVRSTVNWRDSGKDKEVVLDTVLSNWKGGVI